MIRPTALLPCLFFMIIATTACDSVPPAAIHIGGQTMGTTYSVVLPITPKNETNVSLKLAIDKRLKDLNQNLSTWIPESQISLFNKSNSTDWLELPEELVQLVDAANNISQLTGGAYDITVGPIVDLWGFGAGRSSTNSIPNDLSITATLEQVGYKKLNIQNKPPALKKSHSKLEIDLSSIAKGYAVDQIGLVLEAKNIERYLVEIGGEVRTRGLSPRNDDWRIAIEKPDAAQPEAENALRLKDAHLATSGDYRNYFEESGVRYSHTVDARTGKTIQHSLASVTVMHESTMLADAWATALLVLGEDAGFKLAKQESIAAYFIFREGSEFKSSYTEAFAPVLESRPLN